MCTGCTAGASSFAGAPTIVIIKLSISSATSAEHAGAAGPSNGLGPRRKCGLADWDADP